MYVIARGVTNPEEAGELLGQASYAEFVSYERITPAFETGAGVGIFGSGLPVMALPVETPSCLCGGMDGNHIEGCEWEVPHRRPYSGL